MKGQRSKVIFGLVAVCTVAVLSFRIAHADAGVALVAQAPASDIPDGPGRAVVQRLCTQCHGLDYLPGERTIPVWRDILALMKDYGAMATDEEWKAVTDYVIAALAQLHVNKATYDEVRLVFGVDEKTAESVIAYRDTQGGFKTIDDVKKAPGLDAARVDALKARLLFETN